MAVNRINVPGLSEPPGHSHIAIGSGSNLVFTAGHVPLDAEGHLVGENDYRLQTEQVLRNLLSALSVGGAGPNDVVKTTVFVVGASLTAQDAVWSVIQDSPIAAAPSTLVGTALLGYEGQLVEIEAIAMVD